jgi:Xaa-Pro aminopeptidase
MPANLLLYGDTERNAALRHEIPVAIVDPLLYVQMDGRTFIQASSLERDRLAAARPDAELISEAELGFHELLDSGISRDEVWLELVSRAVKRIGITEAIVDFEFPLGVAERLRADGLKLTVDDPTIRMRRRVKSEAEMAGIRRAQSAAEAGMAAAAALLSSAEPVDGKLHVDGRPLLAEDVRAALREACEAAGAPAPPDVIVASVWQGTGHDPGSGPLPAGLPVHIDLWPRDETSGCWADMARTFVVGGEPPEEARRQEALVREALDAAKKAARPGVLGKELHGIACDVFEREGYRTQRTGPGDHPVEGFQFSLGHGVGLQVHEAPSLGRAGDEPLVAGDVVAIEPGLWQRDVGGVGFEDLVLITDDGCETLTSFPYDLTP